VVYRFFDAYWADPDRVPLTIRVDDDLVGFCLLRDAGTRWWISEFYVVPPYRSRGVGAAAVQQIKARCQAAGRHDLIQANTLRWNDHALAFWRSQGFETVSEEPDRLNNVFRLDRQSSSASEVRG